MKTESEASTSQTDMKQEIIPGYTSIEQFTKEGFKTCMEAIRHANALPTGRDLDFYQVSDSFNKIIAEDSNNVLRLMNKIMKCHDIQQSLNHRGLDEKTELVIEANDIILEKVANNIDEMSGIRKHTAEPVVLQTVSAQLPVNGSWNRSSPIQFSVNQSSTLNTSSQNCIRLITAKNIIRPQKFFKDKIDNSNRFPWEPRIKDKPNSLKPLAIFLEEFDNRQEFSHPYELELDRFKPTAEQLRDETPQPAKPLNETELVEINQPEQLDELVQTLAKCKEFAVDLEHHSYRSFMGITCLMQISTKDKDYIIDTLALRDSLHILNEVFTKNTIVKIFHGADQDIEWLQRDLSLYVVNMFDTHQACKLLEYSGLSLAYLLQRFCNVAANKQYQLADWRIRPLPDELKKYAREDTHYLIYIYQMLKHELLLKGNRNDTFLKLVLERSTEICKKRYFKPTLADDSHLEIYRKCKKMFDNRQLYALKELYAWRDKTARDEDESYAYVLPNHMLLQISESLPREMQGILACCSPIPPLVKSHLLELHQIILKARDEPLEKAILKEDTTGRGILKRVSKVNVDSPLHCPHDLSKMSEFRDDLPTLLSQKEKNNNVCFLNIEKNKSIYSIFDYINIRKGKTPRGVAYLSPYERYQLVKPFAQAEELKKQQEEEEKSKAAAEADNRTDEERIASVRDHFLEMSKKFQEDLELKKQEEEKKQQEQSLLQMSGSRKRKREPSENEVEVFVIDDTPNKLHTPKPDFNRNSNNWKKKNNNNRKRKHQDNTQNLDNNQTPSPSKKQRNKQKNKMAMVKQESAVPELSKTQRRKLKQKIKNEDANQSQQNQPQNKKPKQNNNKKQQQQQQQNKAGAQFRLAAKKQKGPKQLQKFRGTQPNRKERENTEFTPYDYASVDFRQFQGGAGSANTGTQIKPAFRGKGQKKITNKHARSSTFNNSYRGGRGRGR